MDFSKLGQAAAATEDMTQNATFERELPKEGIALLRLLSYVETGRHQPKNPAHKPSLNAILTFELSHPKHLIEIDGKKVPQTMQVRIKKGKTSKSGSRKLFAKMNAAYDNQLQHFVQFVGKEFLGEVYHNTVGEGDNKATYANLDKDGDWSLKKAETVDAMTEVATPVPVAELHGTPTAFLWEVEDISDEDYQQMWDSIFIEGTREVEDAKTKEKKEVSKNYIQELIKKNIEWEGSRAQSLFEDHLELDGLENTDDTVKETNKTALAKSAAATDDVDDLEY